MGLGVMVVASNMGLLAAAAYLIAAAAATHLMALLIIPMYAVRVLSATRGLARYVERLVSHRVTFDVLARLRLWLFDQLRRLGPAGMQGTHSGDVLGRVVADVEDLQNAYLLFVSPIVVALAVSALLIGVLFAFSSTIAWTTLGYLAIGGVALPLVAALLTHKVGRALVAARADLNAHLVDSIQGCRDILANRADSRYLERISTDGQRLACAEARLATVSAGREGAVELLTNFALLTALGLTVPLVTHHTLSSLYVTVPALLVLAGFEAIRPLGQAAEVASGVQAAGRRVLSISTRTELVHEPATPAPLQPPYSIMFVGVTLDYGHTGRPAVQDVSFEVSAGSRVAVVGPSGAGKTTLVQLLIRAWDPTEGRILIGGRDIRDYSLHDLRAAMGVVAQDIYLFNDSVRNNLLLARPDATTTELEEALHTVGLLELVRQLPQGLDTWVGEHGERLSGGERQRLAVARVLLQDAPIVLLDEVTANLDPSTERALLDMLYRVTVGRTVLAITHRLVALDRMDEIVVLDRGRIVERGTHEELCAAGGLYRRMLDVQENVLTM
jgi:ATP-binding cassette subfamily C protein CydC